MTERQLHAKKSTLTFLADLVFPRVGGESRARQVLFSTVTLVVGFLFAGTTGIFSAHPFGGALLAVIRSRAWLLYVGLIIGAFFGNGAAAPIYVILYTLILLLRFLFSTPRDGGRILPASRAYFHEMPHLRVAVAAIGGLFIGIYEVIAGDMQILSLLYALSMILLMPTFAFLYLPFFECNFSFDELLGIRTYDVRERLSTFGRFAPFLLSLSEIALGTTLVTALDGKTLFGFSFSALIAALFTLIAAERKGAVTAAIFGFLSILPSAAALAPAYAVLGFLSGIVFPIGALFAVTLGVVGLSAVLGVTGGLPAFLAAVPETVTAAALVTPLLRGVKKERRAEIEEKTVVCYHKNDDLQHMERLSGAFSNLSATLGNMADYMKKPDANDLFALSKRILWSHCTICDKKDECPHTHSESMDEALRTLSYKLAAGERKMTGVFSEKETRECEYLATVLADILSESAEDHRDKSEKGTGDLLSADYAMLAKILSDTAAHDREERTEDTRLSEELSAALEVHGGFRGSVTVFGKRQKEILVTGSHWEGERMSVDEIRTLFEGMCCTRLSEPTFDFSSGQMAITTHTVRRYSAELVTATLAGGGEASGDVIRSFENDEGYFYTLLADGMGSGKMALMTAELTGEYLSELLSSGAAADTALRMLNHVVRQKGCECSASIDLFELDLFYGKAAFIKSGAATSYVRRGSDVFRIRSRTMPIGILKTMDAEKIHFEVAEGDVVVILSDGVSQVPEDAPWLVRLLTDEWDKNLPAMAEKIIEAARAEGRRDDMTVGLIRIDSAKSEKIEKSA